MTHVTVFAKNAKDKHKAGDCLGKIDLGDAQRRHPGDIYVIGVPNFPYRYTLHPLNGNSPYFFDHNKEVIVEDQTVIEEREQVRQERLRKKEERVEARQNLGEIDKIDFSPEGIEIIKRTLGNMSKIL